MRAEGSGSGREGEVLGGRRTGGETRRGREGRRR